MLQKLAFPVHYAALIALCVGLSTSVFLMSLGSIGLALAFLLYGNPLQQLKKVKQDTYLIAAACFFGIHLIGLCWSTDYAFAFNDLRIKLPILLFPVLLAALPQLSKHQFKILMRLFVAATVVSTLISTGIYLEIFPSSRDISDVRNISPFVSHIRLSLVISTAILVMVRWIFIGEKSEKIIAPFLIAWLLYFLYILESATAYSVLSASMLFYIFYQIMHSGKRWVKATFGFSLLLIALFAFLFVRSVFIEFRTPKETRNNLPEFTPRGEMYHHQLDNDMMENGYYTWSNVCYAELKKGWNQRSSIPYDSLDKKNQALSQTLIRYMTSKGLKKDLDGISQLSDEDIRNIENGIANINYTKTRGLRKRIEQVFFEFDVYRYYKNATGNSVTQRLEFWQTATQIIQNHPLIGVGTGDAQLAFNAQYEANHSLLPPSNRLRSHNQFLAIGVAFGIIGIMLFLIYLALPFVKAWETGNLMFLIFYTGAIISLLTEDTLETQAGVAYFCFLGALFYYQMPELQDKTSE